MICMERITLIIKLGDVQADVNNSDKKVVFYYSLSNFGGTLEMPLINCEIDLILTWPVNWVISDAVNEATTIVMTYRKLHIPILNYHVKSIQIN